MEYKMIPCTICNKPMPELRFEKFGYKSCVNCSTTGAYTAVNTINGVGDHTWNDIVIMTPEQSQEYNKVSKKKFKLDSYSTDA
jgi:hypothetical protein|tara:strand:- start:609 stop:857 length:249 start_codon:yes stop_codon:yes gene_type:complete